MSVAAARKTPGPRTPKTRPIVTGRRVSRGAQVSFWIGAGWLTVLVLLAAGADVLPIAPYDRMVGAPLQPPGLTEPFGTDEIGRSVFSRVIYGARTSLVVGTVASVIGVVLGGLLGLVAGYFRGIIETLVDILAEVVQAFPALLFLVAMAAVVRPSLSTLTISLAVLMVPAFARMTKGAVLAQANREFVFAARALGAGHARVLFREILPNTVMSLVSFAIVVMALMIVIEGSVSYLGYGIPLPSPSWGGMAAESEARFATHPHLVLVPVLFLFATVYALNAVGDHLRRRFDVGQSQL